MVEVPDELKARLQGILDTVPESYKEFLSRSPSSMVITCIGNTMQSAERMREVLIGMLPKMIGEPGWALTVEAEKKAGWMKLGMVKGYPGSKIYRPLVLVEAEAHAACKQSPLYPMLLKSLVSPTSAKLPPESLLIEIPAEQ